MQAGRDEVFLIGESRLVYQPDAPAGQRYRHWRDDYAKEPYANHPITGMSWVGAVKYCNWLTLQSGRAAAQRCYREGTNMVDWAPVTCSPTNWSAGTFTQVEREQWVAFQGFRLPMLGTADNNGLSPTNSFNEFVKAATWFGDSSATFGFGRNEIGALDANSIATAIMAGSTTLPVGFFDGINLIKSQATRAGGNYYGLSDLSGNVAEWANDFGAPNMAGVRALCGGGFAEELQPAAEFKLSAPSACASTGGMRPMTTHMPSETTTITILICFHQPGGIRPEDEPLFGTSWAPVGAQTSPEAATGSGTSFDESIAQGPTEGAPGSGATLYGSPDTPGITYKDAGPFPPPPAEGGGSDGSGASNGGNGGNGSNGWGQPGPETIQLIVRSQNPDSGVVIQIDQRDTLGQSDGVTSFGRFYLRGTRVTVTAPSSANGIPFTYWLYNGVRYSSDTSIQLEMWQGTTLTALYGDDPAAGDIFTLTLQSENPASGVPISIDTADISITADGVTPFTRRYIEGTRVRLSTPETLGARQFQQWLRNGVPLTTSPAFLVEMLAHVTYTAVYIDPVPPPQRTLRVNSLAPNSGVPIAVNVADNNGSRDGITGFSRLYDDGMRVTLTAPAAASGRPFQQWLRDGRPFTTARNATIDMRSDATMTAVYGTETPLDQRTLTVFSVDPADGVTISVSTPDANGDTDGPTGFTRVYDFGETTTLTAPATVGANTFVQWLSGSTPISASPSITLSMYSDQVLTAEYTPPPPDVVLTTASANSGGSIPVQVSVPDINGESDGTTLFQREYVEGTATTLTAPAVANNGYLFDSWAVNGSPTTTNRTINLGIYDATTLTAIYVPVPAPPGNITLTIASTNPDSGVTIGVGTPDSNGDGDGTTRFTRIYEEGSGTRLTAPTTSPAGDVFEHWLINGEIFSTNPSFDLALFADTTVTAAYRPPDPLVTYVLSVNSRNPNSSIFVNVLTPDVNGDSVGNTSFTREYVAGTNVIVTARNQAIPGVSNYFQYWELNGAAYSTELTIAVAMTADTAITAVYGNAPSEDPQTVHVESSNPGMGVYINVSQTDNDNLGSAPTLFDRTYDYGTSVTFTAPTLAPGGTAFTRWERNGALISTNLAMTLEVISETTITAVYGPPTPQYNLDVGSANPGGGVAVTVSTPDINGAQDGLTQFGRLYEEGEQVNLTAPAEAPNGFIFNYWTLDGLQVTTNRSIEFTMTRDINTVAVYEQSSDVNLVVRSENPATDVLIGVSLPDLTGLSDGETTFSRDYPFGANVTLTAPATTTPDFGSDPNPFLHWTRNGSIISTDPSLTLELLSDAQVTAVYDNPPGQRRILTLLSLNPNSGVAILVDSDDERAAGDGATPFMRLFEDGTTVTATAPATAGGNNFRWWIIDGVPASTGLSITLEMLANHTVIAEYGPPPDPLDRTLLVQARDTWTGSQLFNVSIQVQPGDNAGNGDGSTLFSRIYSNNTPVTVTASEMADTNNLALVGWEMDGLPLSSERTVNILMASDRTLTALYTEPIPDVTLSVQSRNPATGVRIAVTPTDNDGLASGDTAFQRTYPEGTVTTLTAPPAVDGKDFSYWERNGNVLTTETSFDIALFDDTTVTAVYAGDPLPDEVNLLVESRDPDSGVSIGITVDINGHGSGSTTFNRTYNSEETVVLTAPEYADGSARIFDHWERNGSIVSDNSSLTFTIDQLLADTTMTAVYVEPPPSAGML